MLKKWGTIALGSALALSLAACGSSTDKTSTETKSEPKHEQTKKEEKKKISLADYEAIKVGDAVYGDGGDTYEDIVTKFGEPSTKSESQSGNMKATIATWTKNINGDSGANFNISFIEKDGVKHVTSKGQMGMK
ncbi:DUF3862 domain-containing protein [Bacillus paramycoides]|uniref:DUF3862 domain-containing protein n=1 Tax=Bacillus paramycoides TaxID=2026194 RepID=UPI00405A2674